MNEKQCSCGQKSFNLVFACSGASDVGCISDRAARQLAVEKVASMCCTAAIGADISEIVEKARQASQTLVIDGCDKNCAKIIMEKNGFEGFSHVQLGNLGFKKGESLVTDEAIQSVVQSAKQMISE